MDKGTLVISLDFELLWGVFDKVNWREKKEYFLNTRMVIPDILRLFEKHEISCTWATVGMLFNENWEEWNENVPDILPLYNNEKLSAYNFGKSIQNKETEVLCFAPRLIKLIKDTPRQEIGTHTYSHYYCLEPGQTVKSFKADLGMADKLAAKQGIELKSLVFPRNQYNQDYLTVCRDSGLNTVRINPENWYWRDTQKDSLLQKVMRTGDAYAGLKDKGYSDLPQLLEGVTGQKTSRLLRPNSGKKILDNLRVNRIIAEMKYAAKNKQLYHLWWHPHNFGNHPGESMQELERILLYYVRLKKEYGFNSMSMADLAAGSLQPANG